MINNNSITKNIIRIRKQAILNFIKSFHPSVEYHIQSKDDPLSGLMEIGLILTKPIAIAFNHIKNKKE